MVWIQRHRQPSGCSIWTHTVTIYASYEGHSLIMDHQLSAKSDLGSLENLICHLCIIYGKAKNKLTPSETPVQKDIAAQPVDAALDDLGPISASMKLAAKVGKWSRELLYFD